MSENEVIEDTQANSNQSLRVIFSKGWGEFEELEETSLPFNSAEYQVSTSNYEISSVPFINTFNVA